MANQLYNPYSSTGSNVLPEAKRLKQAAIKYGNEIADALSIPPDDDFADVQAFLGPNFCPGCEE